MAENAPIPPRRPWAGPPMEQLAAFLNRNSRRPGELEPSAAEQFVRQFFEQHGLELVDELFNSYLESVGELYRQKLIDFAIKRGIIDEARSSSSSTPPTAKPGKLVAPSREPGNAGKDADEKRAAS
jgi:hypothetical protein